MGQQAESGVFGIEPETVAQAARIIASSGGDLHGTGRKLQFTGGLPRNALPGGLAAAALVYAAVRVSGAVSGESAETTRSAAALRSYVAAVATAERESAVTLGVDRP